MTELTNSVNVPLFVVLVAAASCLLAVSTEFLLRSRAALPSRSAVAVVGTVSAFYLLAAVRPWHGWGDIGAYPSRVVWGIGEALSYSGAVEKIAVYGVLFLPLGIAVAAAARGATAVLGMGLGFPLAAEAGQALLGTARLASSADYLAAGTGMLLGSAIFLLAHATMHRSARTSGGAAVSPG